MESGSFFLFAYFMEANKAVWWEMMMVGLTAAIILKNRSKITISSVKYGTSSVKFGISSVKCGISSINLKS